MALERSRFWLRHREGEAMKRHFLSRAITLGLVASGVLAGCGSSDDTQAKPISGVVEIFSWWTAPGEKDALDAMLNVYTTKHQGVTVINAAQQGSDQAVALLEQRLTAGNPPDTFQALAGSDLLRWVTRGTSNDSTSIMEPIDFIAQDQ